MEATSSSDGPEKQRGPSSLREFFIHHFLGKQLDQYIRWQEWLKESEQCFARIPESNDNKQKREKVKLTNDDKVNGVDVDVKAFQSKAIANLDWRSSGGALTKEEKTRLNKDLKVLIKLLSSTDSVLTMVTKRLEINEVTT